jgi:antitoxin MazE
MITKVQPWGNSQGIRLPKALLAELNLEAGVDLEIELSPRRDAIVLRPARKQTSVRGRYQIEDLAAAMPKDYRPGEVPWGQEGAEVW